MSTKTYVDIQTLLETLPDGMIVVNRAGKITHVNSRTLQIFGYWRSEVVGQQIDVLIPLRFHEIIRRYIEPKANESVDGLPITEGQVFGRRKNASSVQLDLSIGAMNEGPGLSIVAMVRETQAATRPPESKSETIEILREMASSIEEVFWVTDPGKQRVIYVSPAYDVMFARSRESLMASPLSWIEAIHPDDRERVRNAAVTRQVAGTYRESYRIVRPDGKVRWIQESAYPIRDAYGNVIRLTGVARDITDQKKIEEDLRITKYAVESAISGIVTCDLTGKITYANQSWLEMFGCKTIDQAIGTSPSDYCKNQIEGIGLLDLLKKSGSWIGEILGKRRDGSVFPVQIAANVVLSDTGGPVCLLGSFLDVTERTSSEVAHSHRAEELEQRVLERTQELMRAKVEADRANSAKDDFLSRMSHELRTPMNSILGFSQLLEMQYDDSHIREVSSSIRKAGLHLLKLIDEVLDLTSIENVNVLTSIEPVQVASIVAQTVDMLKPIADAADIDLVVENDGLKESFVLADNHRLAQVMVNLVGNAIKFNRPGGMVRITCREHGERFNRIEVTDTGIGISSKDQNNLFQPFQRFAPPEIEGTGLGLAISRRLVELMGGKLGLSDSTSDGSTFYIDLEKSTPILDKATSQTGSFPRFSQAQGGTVLFVDDNSANMRLMELVFANWKNVTLLTASDGQTGIKLAREHIPDLILLDLNLPDVGGDVVLKMLKSDPKTKSISIVIVSADASPKRMKALRTAGAVEYITKPFDITRLFEVIKGLLPERT